MPNPKQARQTKLNDSIELCDSSQRTFTDEGFMLAPAIVARTGIQFYKGSELGDEEYQKEFNLDPDKVYSVYRPDSEVFNPQYLDSIKGTTLVNNDEIHQSGKEDSRVTAENWKKNAVGEVLTADKHEERFVRCNLIVRDAKAIKDIDSGKNQVSLGYTSNLEWTSGVDRTGNHYDAVQKDMFVNHLAIVKYARAGNVARIADTQENNKNKEENKKMSTVKMIADGVTVEVSESSVQAIEGLLKKLTSVQNHADEMDEKLSEAQEKMTDMKAACDEADKKLEEKDKELADADKEKEELKKKASAADGLDSKIADGIAQGLEAVLKGKALADSVDYKGLTTTEYRKAVITTVIAADASSKTMADAISGGKDVADYDESLANQVFNTLSAFKTTSVKNAQGVQGTKTAIGDAILGAGNQTTTVDPMVEAQLKSRQIRENAYKQK